jgi:hypothetical protein
MPKAPMKKETGNTTFIAAMAIEPIQLPTKIESTKTLRDITKMPTLAGKACLTSKLDIDSEPNCSADTFAI